MAPKSKNPPTDFEGRFFDLLEGTIQGIDQKVTDQGKLLERNTGAIAKLSNRIDKLEVKPKSNDQLSTILSNKSLIYLVFFCLLIFLLIVAAAKGVKVPTL